MNRHPIRTTDQSDVQRPSLDYRDIERLHDLPQYHRLSFNLVKPRCRPRQASRIGRNHNDELYIDAYCPTRKCLKRYYEKDVLAEDWKRVFSERVMERLVPPPEPEKVPAYWLTAYGSYKIVRQSQRNPRTDKMEVVYRIGCQTVPKRRMLALCKAILADEEGWNFE